MNRLSISGAIVLGLALCGALAGLGLYAGLRTGRVAAPLSPAAVAGASVPAPKAAAPAPAPVGPARDARAELISQLALLRSALAARCWDAAAAQAAGLTSTRYDLDLVFAPDGKQMARGLRAGRGASIPAIDSCVARALPALVAPPTETSLSLHLPLVLP